MLLNQQQYIVQRIQDKIKTLGYYSEVVGFDNPLNIELEPCKSINHGHVSSNIAMKISGVFAKDSSKIKLNPREIANNIVKLLEDDKSLKNIIDKYEVAGPGFINLFLNSKLRGEIIQTILIEKEKFAYNLQNINNLQNIIIEFVSANPTGPLHIGHARQAALGDCLANILKTQGHEIYKEFYYNDAGVQIKNLATSVYMRAKGYNPQNIEWPQDAYNGEYIVDIANAYINKQTIQAQNIAPITASGNLEDLDDIQKFAVAYLRKEQDEDLQIFGVKFDNHYLESSLYADGKVQEIVNQLIQNKQTYTQSDESKGEALYFKTTNYGDDKDRVMQKSDGSYTYFVPDIAYHVEKFRRNFNSAINIQGFDHHSTITRVRAGLQALNINIPANFPQYILHKMVTVMKNGQEVKISKRAGSYITMRDLVEWSSNDSNNLQKGKEAVRFFLISKKAETEFVFDVDLALKQSDENPVYYIQYAHARICSIIEQSNITPSDIIQYVQNNNTLSKLEHENEINLINKLGWYPDVLKKSAQEMTPHSIAFYLRELSSLFHSLYNSCKVLVDDYDLKISRLALLMVTKQIISNALGLLGVSAPQKM